MRVRPVVGLLYNPVVPDIIDRAGSLVDAVEVIPERLWYDFGTTAARRFTRINEAITRLRRYTENRIAMGHGIGLSLPSALPLDAALLDEVATLAVDLKFAWYSEHLSTFTVPGGSVPDAQAGLGLPVPYDTEVLDLLAAKVAKVAATLGVEVLLENGTIFTPIPEAEMTEPEFLNALYARCRAGTLLDLHNLYTNCVNNGLDADAYLSALDPLAVKEIHLAGGDEIDGFYTDSHSRPTPAIVWELANEWVPRFPNVRALVYEFHESYYPRLGLSGIVTELELMHGLADDCMRPSELTASTGSR